MQLNRVRWMAAASTAIRSSGEVQVARARRSAASKRALVLGAGAAGAACTGVLFFLGCRSDALQPPSADEGLDGEDATRSHA